MGKAQCILVFGFQENYFPTANQLSEPQLKLKTSVVGINPLGVVKRSLAYYLAALAVVLDEEKH